MADREQRGTKRPSDQERMERLNKAAKTGDRGKGIARSSSTAPSKAVAPPSSRAAAAPPSRTVAPPPAPASRPPSRHEARSGHSREDSCLRDDRPVTAGPAHRSRREDSRPRDAIQPAPGVEPSKRTSSVLEALVSKFYDKLSVGVAKSSRRTDPIAAIDECVEKLIDVSCCCCEFSGMLVCSPD